MVTNEKKGKKGKNYVENMKRKILYMKYGNYSFVYYNRHTSSDVAEDFRKME
jgi:hypothetical protein